MESIELKEYKCDLHRRSFVTVDKGVVAGNADGIGSGQISHGQHPVGVSEQILGARQSGLEEPAIPHSIRSAKQGNLLGMKGQGFKCTNPDRLYHLFGQFLKCVAVTADDAVGNLHFGAELFIVWGDLESR